MQHVRSWSVSKFEKTSLVAADPARLIDQFPSSKGFLSFSKALFKGFLSFLKAFVEGFLYFSKALVKGFLTFSKALFKGFSILSKGIC